MLLQRVVFVKSVMEVGPPTTPIEKAYLGQAKGHKTLLCYPTHLTHLPRHLPNFSVRKGAFTSSVEVTRA